MFFCIACENLFIGGELGRFVLRKPAMKKIVGGWFEKRWYRKDGRLAEPAEACLRLAERGYLKMLRRHQAHLRASRHRLDAFVISVGNMTVGGTGKTPFCMWLARRLSAGGCRTAVLSRGYGRSASSVARVPPSLEGAGCDDRYGDEPVLLAAGLPEVSVWVGSARWKTGEAAIRCDGAEVIILDDGFQHLSLERDVDLVLLDGKNPFGNGRLLPVGPLREPVEHLGRADAFVLSDDGSGGEGSGNDDGGSAAHRVLFPRVPIFRFRRRVRGFRQGFMGTRFPPNALEGKRVLAFCGIARPERFFNTLKSLGIWVCTTLVFPDHHRFRPRDWERIFSLARKSGASYLVTTEKDLVRVPPALRPALISVELETYLGPDENRFMAFMAAKFRASRPGRPLCFR